MEYFIVLIALLSSVMMIYDVECVPTNENGNENVVNYHHDNDDDDDDDEKCILGTQSGCSTSVCSGLTSQILSEMNSMGYSFKTMDANWIRCSSPCVNQLQSAAADNLVAAARSKNDYITLNSAVRSSAQQYLLYMWYLRGICSISLAAVPGTSNHEGGRAIDTSYYDYWKPTLTAYNWTHTYPSSDPVHFDYTRVSDLANQNLLAFQRLWNRYNPNNRISEDGIYGAQTENALYNSPCSGW